MIIAYYTKTLERRQMISPLDKSIYFEIEILEGMKSPRFIEIFNESCKSPVGDKTHRVWEEDGLIWRYIGSSHKEYDYEFIMNTDKAQIPQEIKQFIRDNKIKTILE